MHNFSGADLIALALAELKVDHAFGIVSIHNLPIFDAIHRLGKTQLINVRHELAGAHSADGYARATGKLAVLIASTGPGTANTISGLYEAHYASSRVLLITTQAETQFYGRGLGYVHESENQVPMLATVCGHVESPRRVDDISDCLQRVIDHLFNGRPRPAAIEIPLDLQRADATPAPIRTVGAPRNPANEVLVRDALLQLQSTTKRVAIAGGGVISSDAATLFQEFVERLDCPVITTEAGRGALPENHPLCIGNYYASPRLHDSIRPAELTIAIGTRFAAGIGGEQASMPPPGKLIQVDIDPSMIGRTHQASVGVQADASAFLSQMLEGLNRAPKNDQKFNEVVLQTSQRLKASMRKRLGPDFVRIMDTMRELLPDSGILVRDQTVSAYNWGNQQFPILHPRTSIHPASGALGPGLPLAIGAAIGTGQKTAVIHGDGGMLFHATELATAAQYKAPVIVCVFNDSGYGVLRWMQKQQFGRIAETDLGKVSFTQMAHSMGVNAERVRNVEEFELAYSKAIDMAGPYLIDIDMEHFEPMQSMTLLPEESNEVHISG